MADDANRELEQRFHLRWVAEAGRPPLGEEREEFEAARRWFAYGAIELNDILKDRSID